MIPYRLWVMLAFSRIPGNAFSFWIRQRLRWSRGRPVLPHESKEGLFDYLDEDDAEEGAAKPAATALVKRAHSSAFLTASARERELHARYRLDALERTSTQTIYRKNIYLLDLLERAAQGLASPFGSEGVQAIDVGPQDWHYVFGLERWLRHQDDPTGRPVYLQGIEVDGYGIYPDFRSRRDYALAYADQTGNSDVTYKVGDFLDEADRPADIITIFYPFVTRHHLLLWGLPLRFFQPVKLLAKAAAMIKPGGWLMVFTHTLKEHELFLELGRRSGKFVLLKQGAAVSNLVDFHEDVVDRRFSVWKRT